MHTSQPNIIFINADDLGYGDLGCYGQETIRTPNIDRMAEEGMCFSNHYAGHTVCRPSRLSLWTGCHTGHTAISSNDQYHFERGETTVAELLKKAGYATGGVGKWSMGGVGSGGHPNEHGFDYWFGFLDQGRAHNYYPPYLWENREKFWLEGNKLMDAPGAKDRIAEPDGREVYSNDVMNEKALTWIERQAESGTPFLFHGHYTLPHANNEGGRVLGDGMEVPDYGEYADRDWPDVEKGFAAMVTRLDSYVGSILALLCDLGIEQETLVIFTSDNGPHKEGGHDHRFFSSNGPLRGIKRDLYEGGIRVPMIAWWPETIAPGKKTDHISAHWDFLPTACELAGLHPPEGIDGLSYLPELLGQSEKQARHDYLYWQFRESRAVRFGKWKAVQNGPDEDIELFDLSEDIGESNNLAHRYPEQIRRAEEIIREYGA